MLVEVTQEHINQGFVSGNSSPIALAMQENGFANVRVEPWHILYDEQLTQLQVHINPNFSVVQWIFDFDGGEEVFPIKIEIDEDAGYATLVE